MATARRRRQDQDPLNDAVEMTGNLRHDEIARRAYELYEQRGRGDGWDWDDWFRAEHELRQSGAADVAA